MIGPVSRAPQFHRDLAQIDLDGDVAFRRGPAVLADGDAAMQPGRPAKHEVHASHGFARPDDDRAAIGGRQPVGLHGNDVGLFGKHLQRVSPVGAGSGPLAAAVVAGPLPFGPGEVAPLDEIKRLSLRIGMKWPVGWPVGPRGNS